VISCQCWALAVAGFISSILSWLACEKVQSTSHLAFQLFCHQQLLFVHSITTNQMMVSLRRRMQKQDSSLQSSHQPPPAHHRLLSRSPCESFLRRPAEAPEGRRTSHLTTEPRTSTTRQATTHTVFRAFSRVTRAYMEHGPGTSSCGNSAGTR
jgi:hypothetical protein